ncbi:bifunctional hydroxymethylpyrimidine kinase/phosphomethylpyrimidine kinase [Salinicola rhizosphaerae]|uniref:hydroxymethylpyrimidine kinase n=1 Tax=Salinicola rhizosphaerae TaxID=1443141 RepID=A0ABQ3DRV4_9GAMM|nr:bifunctional hydroxymethylpyrimidine kinase/phosphomethylpyrimidine kinase [Salinicola rhizosphaerae]GHB12454.1 hydroxymethylpyrimidine/phosphomethylpyrimidine kinase [Salinicola rhizosphaerae]
MDSAPIPNVLTIAGSDPSGGAGLQADLKTFSALGTYATNVITAVIAQNTQGVVAVEPVTPAMIRTQLDNLLEDVEIEAVKIGMVASRDVAEAIAEALSRRRPRWVVLDPVMVAKSGDRLVDDEGLRAVRDILVPLADVITPNLPEAAALLNSDMPQSLETMKSAVAELGRLGSPNGLLKGGHLAFARCPDLLWTPSGERWLDAPRLSNRNLHGAGCALSSAIAAKLAHFSFSASARVKASPREMEAGIATAIVEAKTWLHQALAAGERLSVGHGMGPPHHFHAWW